MTQLRDLALRGTVGDRLFAQPESPASIVDGDVWVDTDAVSGELEYLDHGDVTTTKTIDMSQAKVQRIRLTSASCALTFSGFSATAVLKAELWIVQDGTGGRLITYTNTVTSPGGSTLTAGIAGENPLSTAAAARDKIVYTAGPTGSPLDADFAGKGYG